MKINPLSLIQKDFLSLSYYLHKNESSANDKLEIEDIKRHLIIKMRQMNNEIPDHFYKQIIAEKFDSTECENRIDSLACLFLKGICDGLGKEFLEINEDKRIFVKEEKFLEWQNLIEDMSPAFLIAAYLVSYDGISSIDLSNSSEIREIFNDYILSNCRYTTLLSPNIKPVQDLFLQVGGFNDLHIHINGVTEMDAVWQNLFYDRDSNLNEIAKNIANASFKQQLEQINLNENCDICFIKKLLDRALIIRNEFFNLCFNANSFDIISSDSISGRHPFRYLFSPTDLEEQLPNKEIRYEVLMFYLVLANIKHGNNSEQLASFLHEYLLIYGFFEEILVHNKECFGFEQFQNITKNNIRDKVDECQLNKILQLNGNDNNLLNFVEFRFSPKNDIDNQIALIQKIDADSRKFSDFIKNNSDDNKNCFDYRLIAHFIKSYEKFQNDYKKENSKSIKSFIRYYELRKQLDDKCDKLIATINTFGSGNKIVAVDAAASEFDTPSEVFAPVFRRLRKTHSIYHFTYHAGEDFYHILDGLRAIYEAIVFLDFKHGDRIGHASATGTDVVTWADILMKEISIPKGIYMDDLIFAHSFILEEKIESLYSKLPMIEIKAKELEKEVYGESFSLEDLKSAWKNRYKDSRLIKTKKSDKLLYGNASDNACEYEIVDETDFEILSLYNKKEIFQKYKEPINIDVFEIFYKEELILLQKKMLEFMHKKEIVIEALPTSNLRIGYHRTLQSYQLLNWYKWREEGLPIPPVVLGTDDPGIFATNIYNEYSMLYCYLVYERKMPRTNVIKFLQDIHNNSRVYAFK